jgi:RecQ-mediated genome instability protein 1
LLDEVEHQILESSFTESMLPGTGLPTYSAVPTTTMTLEGLEIRVEIVSIMEIANSAFSLNQTRLAREERMKAGDVDDGEGEGDIEVEGEGPMPRYSRGMLKLQLTDGTTVLPAIEYRLLPNLSLENTPLGYKVVTWSNNACPELICTRFSL